MFNGGTRKRLLSSSIGAGGRGGASPPSMPTSSSSTHRSVTPSSSRSSSKSTSKSAKLENPHKSHHVHQEKKPHQYNMESTFAKPFLTLPPPPPPIPPPPPPTAVHSVGYFPPFETCLDTFAMAAAAAAAANSTSEAAEIKNGVGGGSGGGNGNSLGSSMGDYGLWQQPSPPAFPFPYPFFWPSKRPTFPPFHSSLLGKCVNLFAELVQHSIALQRRQ
jgi:hypothetical protein